MATPLREEAEGQRQPEEAAEVAPSRSHARARARAALTALLAVLGRWWGRRRQLTADEAAAPGLTRRSLWREPPPSLADIWANIRVGAFAPGERAWPIEWAGKAYGGLVIAVAGAAYGALWVIGRPSRLASAVAVLVLLHLAGGAR